MSMLNSLKAIQFKRPRIVFIIILLNFSIGLVAIKYLFKQNYTISSYDNPNGRGEYNTYPEYLNILPSDRKIKMNLAKYTHLLNINNNNKKLFCIILTSEKHLKSRVCLF